MSELSVHDNHIVAYTVFAKERRIVLQTVFPHSVSPERTDVIFDEVLAYHFQNDLFGAIISDIVEIEVTALLTAEAIRFEEGWKQGWPRGWERNKESLEAYVKRLEMRAFELGSSYGMDGWVIAERMSLVPVD